MTKINPENCDHKGMFRCLMNRYPDQDMVCLKCNLTKKASEWEEIKKMQKEKMTTGEDETNLNVVVYVDGVPVQDPFEFKMVYNSLNKDKALRATIYHPEGMILATVDKIDSYMGMRRFCCTKVAEWDQQIQGVANENSNSTIS